MFKSVALVLVSLVALSASAREAHAQAPGYGYAPPPPPAPSPTPNRDGFTLGVALGGGQLSVEDERIEADYTQGLSLRGGLALSQSWLLQGVIDVTRADNEPDGERKGSLQLNFYGVSLTGYLFPRLFLTLGAGYASLSVDDTDPIEASSGAMMLGAGVELIQTTHFALSFEVRGFGAAFEESKVGGLNAVLGFQFF